jgi:hypothetical protein
MTKPDIVIEGRVYRSKSRFGGYQIAIEELGELRMREIPANSYIEITGLPRSDIFGFELHCENDTYGDARYLLVQARTGAIFQDNWRRAHRRLKRAFPDTISQTSLPNPMITASRVEEGVYVSAHVNMMFEPGSDIRVRDAINSLIRAFRQLSGPEVRLFISYASEDTQAARRLVRLITDLNLDVWFAERKIRVGDSIVQKINGALGDVTHFLLLLSRNSVNKPWVLKEFSSALMRQLGDKSIAVLPLRLDDSPIRPILADIRYADARLGLEKAVRELKDSLFPVL